MPTRVIRDGILTSERVNALSPHAELFYRRLMSVVDDYGRFSANLTLLRASCYPLKLDSVKEDSIKKHLAEAEGAGLIVLYTVAGKAYLEMQDFGQRIQSKSKFPAPPENTNNPPPISDENQDSTVNHGGSPGKTALVGVEDGEKTLSGKPDETPSKPADQTLSQAKEVLAYLNQKAGRSYRPNPANLDLIKARLKEGTSLEALKTVIDVKTAQWLDDPKMADYLRPATLFNRTKCEQYLGRLQNGSASCGLEYDV